MSSEIKESCLGEIVASGEAALQTGPFGTMLKASEYSKSGAPVISVGEIREGFLAVESKTPRVSEEVISRLPRFILEENDIVFGRKGRTHRNALIKKEEEGYFLGSDGIRLRVNSDTLCPKFISYQLRSKKAENWLKMNSEGTTMPSLNQDILSRFPITILPTSDQKAIAHILGTLDEKIELNRKTNKTLEGIAKALFKSWFVDFDPVRAKAEGRPTGLPDEIGELFPDSFEESELGEIPSGWSLSSIGEISKNLDRLRVPLSKKQRSEKQGSFPYYGATGIFDYVDDFLFDGDYLLIGEDGSVAKEDGTAFSQYVSGKIWVNNHAHVLEGILPVTTEFLYCFFQFAQVTPYVTGAVQLKLSQGRMNMIQLPLAGEKLLCLFGETVRPIFSRIQSIQKEILSLGELRDVLLPRLISGELRVPDAEKMLEEAGV